MLILLGTDVALLEGLAQTLSGGGAGHRVRVAHTTDDAVEFASRSAPLLLVVERRMLLGEQGERIAAIPLAPGGAIVVYRATERPDPIAALPRGMARTTLADLALPLERQRLVALAQYVATRARESGRIRFDTPPERHAP